MRTVSATHLAAQRVATQRPRVRVLVRDKQARLRLLGRQSVEDVQSAACVAGDGLTIVIAALDTSGCIRVRRVTDPSLLDPTGGAGVGWGWYTDDYVQVVAAGAAYGWPNGDICISNNSGTLRLFYVNSVGSNVLALESADNGATWGAPITVRNMAGAAIGYRVRLATAGHDDMWYTVQRANWRYVYSGSVSGGVWGAWTHVQYLMETGGEYINCYGLAVQWDAVLSKYAVVASLDRASNGDGRIVAAHWTRDGGITDYQGIVPPGWPAAGFAPWSPALLKTSDALGTLWVLTYWDTFSSGATSWATPMCILSRDFVHWSYRIPLAFTETANRKRINAVELASVVYLHDINEAYRVDLWYSGKASHELTISQASVLRYKVSERPEQGELYVDIDNRNGAYDAPGITGYTAAPMRPLAQIIVDHGLNTSAGDERVESRPFYLWSHSTVRESGVNLVRLYAVDGWQLLRMWRPDCTIQWQGKTLAWCIAEIASRAGNWAVTTDGDAVWSRTLTYLTVAARQSDYADAWWMRFIGRWVRLSEPMVIFSPEMTGLAILHHLLSLVGGVMRFGNGDSREVLHCFIPAAQGESPVAVHTYNDGELLGLESVDGFAWPTRVRVTGSVGGYEGQSITNALAVGMDILQMVYASQWATAAQLQTIADGALDDGAARARGGWLRTRPNAGLELFDIVTFTDSKAGAGLTSVKRRINGLLTEYDPLEKVWLQTVYVEGV